MADPKHRVYVICDPYVPFGMVWMYDGSGEYIGETELVSGISGRIPAGTVALAMGPIEFMLWESWAERKGIKPVTIN